MNHWHVITGAPSSGKTTLLAHLAFQGFTTRPEAARVLIDSRLSEGATLEEIRADEACFQDEVLSLKIQAEAREPKDSLVIWERGMPDSIVYLEACGGDTTRARAACASRAYQKIFLLEPLPIYRRDYARTEDEATARRLHERLGQCYQSLGYEVVRVPVASVFSRAKLVSEKVGRPFSNGH